MTSKSWFSSWHKSLRPIKTVIGNQTSQSWRKVNACSLRQVRENTGEQIAIACFCLWLANIVALHSSANQLRNWQKTKSIVKSAVTQWKIAFSWCKFVLTEWRTIDSSLVVIEYLIALTNTLMSTRKFGIIRVHKGQSTKLTAFLRQSWWLTSSS